MCEFEGMVTTQMMRWDARFESVVPIDYKRAKDVVTACIHCVYWI
jgi:hypothetical protein